MKKEQIAEVVTISLAYLLCTILLYNFVFKPVSHTVLEVQCEKQVKIESTKYNLQDAAIIIKHYESCKLVAYQPEGEDHVKYPLYTIGWGHYGVKAGTVWTQEQADQQLKKDIIKCADQVKNSRIGFSPNENQFNSLISFCYNAGSGNLNKLLDNGRRNSKQVSNKLLLYTKSGNNVLPGLIKRRNIEKSLFDGTFNYSF